MAKRFRYPGMRLETVLKRNPSLGLHGFIKMKRYIPPFELHYQFAKYWFATAPKIEIPNTTTTAWTLAKLYEQLTGWEMPEGCIIAGAIANRFWLRRSGTLVRFNLDRRWVAEQAAKRGRPILYRVSIADYMAFQRKQKKGGT